LGSLDNCARILWYLVEHCDWHQGFLTFLDDIDDDSESNRTPFLAKITKYIQPTYQHVDVIFQNKKINNWLKSAILNMCKMEVSEIV
jgi:hypothetical protein